MSLAMKCIYFGLGLLFGTFAFAGGVAAQVVWDRDPKPTEYWVSCPTEDSCTANYEDGRWHIEQVTP
jgi:hypothetical protein